jgi:hypothetical protein
MTRRMVQGGLVGLLLIVASSPAFAQASQSRHERRPAALPQGPSPLVQPVPEYVSFPSSMARPGFSSFITIPNWVPISRSMFICSRSSCKGGPTWPDVEFTVAKGARVIQSNEDGQVWWSDDVECWASRDRFKPF